MVFLTLETGRNSYLSRLRRINALLNSDLRVSFGLDFTTAHHLTSRKSDAQQTANLDFAVSVLHGQPRHVVLCLLEVSRLTARFGIEPAGLVQLEREIAEEQERELHCLSDSGISHSSLVSWQYQPASPAPDKMKHSRFVRGA